MFYILVLFLFITPSFASEPITDDMIDEGLRAYSGEGRRGNDYLAPFRLFDSYESLKDQRLFMLHVRTVRFKDGPHMKVLFMTLMKEFSGIMLLFEWDQHKSDRENYRMINQVMYKTGDFAAYQGRRRLGSLQFSFRPCERTKNMGYQKGLGYYQLANERDPMVYCTIDYYRTVDWIQKQGIGTLIIDEFKNLIFGHTSVDFIAAQVDPYNTASVTVFIKNRFLRLMDMPDKEAPGYDREKCTGRSSGFISFDNEKTFIQAGFAMGYIYNLYLPRTYAQFSPTIKSSL